MDVGHGMKIVADALINDCSETVFDLISLPVSVYLMRGFLLVIDSLDCVSILSANV